MGHLMKKKSVNRVSQVQSRRPCPFPDFMCFKCTKIQITCSQGYKVKPKLSFVTWNNDNKTVLYWSIEFECD